MKIGITVDEKKLQEMRENNRLTSTAFAMGSQMELPLKEKPELLKLSLGSTLFDSENYRTPEDKQMVVDSKYDPFDSTIVNEPVIDSSKSQYFLWTFRSSNCPIKRDVCFAVERSLSNDLTDIIHFCPYFGFAEFPALLQCCHPDRLGNEYPRPDDEGAL